VDDFVYAGGRLLAEEVSLEDVARAVGPAPELRALARHRPVGARAEASVGRIAAEARRREARLAVAEIVHVAVAVIVHAVAAGLLGRALTRAPAGVRR
jgi:hypothetical protein